MAVGMPKVASNTITDPAVFRAELASIRAERCAFDDLEFADDMRCIAVPLFEARGIVPGAIAISGPASRFDMAKLQALRDVLLRMATRSRQSSVAFCPGQRGYGCREDRVERRVYGRVVACRGGCARSLAVLLRRGHIQHRMVSLAPLPKPADRLPDGYRCGRALDGHDDVHGDGRNRLCANARAR